MPISEATLKAIRDAGIKDCYKPSFTFDLSSPRDAEQCILREPVGRVMGSASGYLLVHTKNPQTKQSSITKINVSQVALSDLEEQVTNAEDQNAACVLRMQAHPFCAAVKDFTIKIVGPGDLIVTSIPPSNETVDTIVDAKGTIKKRLKREDLITVDTVRAPGPNTPYFDTGVSGRSFEYSCIYFKGDANNTARNGGKHVGNFTHSSDVKIGDSLLQSIGVDADFPKNRMFVVFNAGYQKTPMKSFTAQSPIFTIHDYATKTTYLYQCSLDSLVLGDATFIDILVGKCTEDGQRILWYFLKQPIPYPSPIGSGAKGIEDFHEKACTEAEGVFEQYLKRQAGQAAAQEEKEGGLILDESIPPDAHSDGIAADYKADVLVAMERGVPVGDCLRIKGPRVQFYSYDSAVHFYPIGVVPPIPYVPQAPEPVLPIAASAHLRSTASSLLITKPHQGDPIARKHFRSIVARIKLYIAYVGDGVISESHMGPEKADCSINGLFIGFVKQKPDPMQLLSKVSSLAITGMQQFLTKFPQVDAKDRSQMVALLISKKGDYSYKNDKQLKTDIESLYEEQTTGSLFLAHQSTVMNALDSFSGTSFTQAGPLSLCCGLMYDPHTGEPRLFVLRMTLPFGSLAPVCLAPGTEIDLSEHKLKAFIAEGGLQALGYPVLYKNNQTVYVSNALVPYNDFFAQLKQYSTEDFLKHAPQIKDVLRQLPYLFSNDDTLDAHRAQMESFLNQERQDLLDLEKKQQQLLLKTDAAGRPKNEKTIQEDLLEATKIEKILRSLRRKFSKEVHSIFEILQGCVNLTRSVKRKNRKNLTQAAILKHRVVAKAESKKIQLSNTAAFDALRYFSHVYVLESGEVLETVLRQLIAPHSRLTRQERKTRFYDIIRKHPGVLFQVNGLKSADDFIDRAQREQHTSHLLQRKYPGKSLLVAPMTDVSADEAPLPPQRSSLLGLPLVDALNDLLTLEQRWDRLSHDPKEGVAPARHMLRDEFVNSCFGAGNNGPEGEDKSESNHRLKEESLEINFLLMEAYAIALEDALLEHPVPPAIYEPCVRGNLQTLRKEHASLEEKRKEFQLTLLRSLVSSGVFSDAQRCALFFQTKPQDIQTMPYYLDLSEQLATIEHEIGIEESQDFHKVRTVRCLFNTLMTLYRSSSESALTHTYELCLTNLRKQYHPIDKDTFHHTALAVKAASFLGIETNFLANAQFLAIQTIYTSLRARTKSIEKAKERLLKASQILKAKQAHETENAKKGVAESKEDQPLPLAPQSQLAKPKTDSSFLATGSKAIIELYDRLPSDLKTVLEEAPPPTETDPAILDAFKARYAYIKLQHTAIEASYRRSIKQIAERVLSYRRKSRKKLPSVQLADRRSTGKKILSFWSGANRFKPEYRFDWLKLKEGRDHALASLCKSEALFQQRQKTNKKDFKDFSISTDSMDIVYCLQPLLILATNPNQKPEPIAAPKKLLTAEEKEVNDAEQALGEETATFEQETDAIPLMSFEKLWAFLNIPISQDNFLLLMLGQKPDDSKSQQYLKTLQEIITCLLLQLDNPEKSMNDAVLVLQKHFIRPMPIKKPSPPRPPAVVQSAEEILTTLLEHPHSNHALALEDAVTLLCFTFRHNPAVFRTLLDNLIIKHMTMSDECATKDRGEFLQAIIERREPGILKALLQLKIQHGYHTYQLITKDVLMQYHLLTFSVLKGNVSTTKALIKEILPSLREQLTFDEALLTAMEHEHVSPEVIGLLIQYIPKQRIESNEKMQVAYQRLRNSRTDVRFSDIQRYFEKKDIFMSKKTSLFMSNDVFFNPSSSNLVVQEQKGLEYSDEPWPELSDAEDEMGAGPEN